MWHVYARSWLRHQLDRLAIYWLARPAAAVWREIEQYMAENAKRSDGP